MFGKCFCGASSPGGGLLSRLESAWEGGTGMELASAKGTGKALEETGGAAARAGRSRSCCWKRRSVARSTDEEEADSSVVINLLIVKS